jgi:lia operon protein LiaF
MRKFAVILGSFFIFIGLLNLAEAIFHIDLGKFFWPLVLVFLGVWLLFRPKFFPGWFGGDFHVIGDSKYRDASAMFNRESSTFIGDTLLDFSTMNLEAGLTDYRLNGFVGDIKVIVPENVGVNLRSNCFVSEFKLFGEEMSNVMAPGEYTTPGYSTAEKKVDLTVNYFVVNVKLVRPQ